MRRDSHMVSQGGDMALHGLVNKASAGAGSCGAHRMRRARVDSFILSYLKHK